MVAASLRLLHSHSVSVSDYLPPLTEGSYFCNITIENGVFTGKIQIK